MVGISSAGIGSGLDIEGIIGSLMAAERIQGWPRRKRRGFGRVASGRPAGVKNLLERDFSALEPERK